MGHWLLQAHFDQFLASFCFLFAASVPQTRANKRHTGGQEREQLHRACRSGHSWYELNFWLLLLAAGEEKTRDSTTKRKEVISLVIRMRQGGLAMQATNLCVVVHAPEFCIQQQTR